MTTTTRVRSRSGSALLIAMIALMTILVLGAAFMRLGMSTRNGSNAALDQDRAFYLAEAAIAEAGTAIIAGRSGQIADQALPARLGNGLFWVTSTDLGGGDFQLDATAMCDTGRAAVRAVVHKTASSAGSPAALLGDTSVTLGSDVLVDSYDPTKGRYATQTKRTVPGNSRPIVNTNGHVRSNHAVSVASSDDLFGNVTPGPSLSVLGLLGSAFIYGSTAAAPQTVAFPPVVVPTISSQGAKSVLSTDSALARTLVPGSYHYASLTLDNDAALTIQGPATIVIDAFSAKSHSALSIDSTGGPVQVYFTGDTDFAYTMNLTTTGTTAKDVSLSFCSNKPVDLHCYASLVGTIYAPTASVDVDHNFEVFGSIKADRIDVSSDAKIHYDESLIAVGRAALPSLAVASWHRQVLPTPRWTRIRSDPFALLGVQKSSCPKPANAWR